MSNLKNPFTDCRSYEEIMQIEPKEMAEILTKFYTPSVPNGIENSDDVQEAGRLLGLFFNNYSFLSSLSSYAQLSVRAAKRSGDKQLHEDMVDKKKMIEDATNRMHQAWQAVSRMFTAYQTVLQELKMSDFKKS